MRAAIAGNTPETRKIHKTVSVTVDVEITPSDFLKALRSDDLRGECARRGIELKRPKSMGGDPRHKIAQREIYDILDCWRANNFDDALFKLEWALPQVFRGFADATAKHYAGNKP